MTRIYQIKPDGKPARFNPSVSVTLEVPCSGNELVCPLTDRDLGMYLQELQSDPILKVVNETTTEIHECGLYELRYYCTDSGQNRVTETLEVETVKLWVVPS